MTSAENSVSGLQTRKFFLGKDTPRTPLQGSCRPWGGGGTLGISEWGCAAGTVEPLTYTRASSAEFCYPILE